MKNLIESLKRPGYLGVFVSMLAGGLTTLSFAPWFWWPLGVLGCAVLAITLNDVNVKQAFWRGWSYGFGLFITGVSWVYISMAEHSNTAVWLSLLMTISFAAFIAFFYALFGYAYKRWVSSHALGNTLGFAAIWVLGEWFRTWFLTGFPWLFLGDAHLNSPLSGWAPVVGTLGITFMVALTGAVLAQAVQKRSEMHKGYWLVLLPWVLGPLLASIEWTQPTGRAIKVAAIQGNVPQDFKWKTEAIEPTLKDYSYATWAVADADLVVWPETAITLLLNDAQYVLDQLTKQAKADETNLITGIPYLHSPLKTVASPYHNSVIGVGLAEGIYHKQKLVPFGEYVPFAEYIRGVIDFFNLPMSSFSRGSSDQGPLKIKVDGQWYSVAPFICYEIVYPNLVAKLAAQSEILVTISNDAWFGRSIGPKQHMAMAQMRALETGRYLIRSTNTGITALVDPKGKILKALPTYEQGTLVGEAKLMTGNTPFMLLGYWPVVLFAFLLAAVINFRSRRQVPETLTAE